MKFVRERLVKQRRQYLDADIIRYSTEQERRLPKKRKRELTPEAVKKQNEKNRRRYLKQLINTNFSDEDYRLDLTYADEPENTEQAKKDLTLFVERLRRLYKKHGAEFRYIKVTGGGREKENGGRTRVHHHLVLSGGVPRGEIENQWKKGRKSCQRLQADAGGYEGLANYLLQQRECGKNEAAYTPSRNLKRPIETRDDGKFGASDMRRFCEAARRGELKKALERIYRGWRCIEARIEYNEVTGFPAVRAKFYKMQKKE